VKNGNDAAGAIIMAPRFCVRRSDTMPLVTSKEMLLTALKNHFAVGAFNANNMEQVQGIVEAAQEERAPVILQVSQGAIRYAGLGFAAALVKTAADLVDIPVVLHLDHGYDFDQNVRCLRAGFTSLMYDGSKKPYEENVATTKRIVEIAHIAGIPVEAELGRVAQSGDDLSYEQICALMTDPHQAKDFVETTGVDSLAVACGSVHAMRIQHGICKINVATHLNQAFRRGMQEGLVQYPDSVDPRKPLALSREYVKEAVREKIRLFRSAGVIASTGGFHSPAKQFRSAELGAAE
jgi:fructose-bisphosphate aldolase class II